MFDPHQQLLRQELELTYAPLRGRWGEYRHDSRTIVLLPGLTATQERCVLTHELVHAWYGDGIERADPQRRWWLARAERRADTIAARLLIAEEDLAQAVRIHPEDPTAVAIELGVTLWLLKVALAGLQRRRIGDDLGGRAG